MGKFSGFVLNLPLFYSLTLTSFFFGLIIHDRLPPFLWYFGIHSRLAGAQLNQAQDDGFLVAFHFATHPLVL